MHRRLLFLLKNAGSAPLPFVCFPSGSECFLLPLSLDILSTPAPCRMPLIALRLLTFHFLVFSYNFLLGVEALKKINFKVSTAALFNGWGGWMFALGMRNKRFIKITRGHQSINSVSHRISPQLRVRWGWEWRNEWKVSWFAIVSIHIVKLISFSADDWTFIKTN